jgi:FMN-dependent NADH-azoreductase
VLLASGGVYDGDFAPYEHAISLARAELGFMGIKDIQTVTAAGMNLLPPDQIKAAQAKALAEVQAIAAAW